MVKAAPKMMDDFACQHSDHIGHWRPQEFKNISLSVWLVFSDDAVSPDLKQFIDLKTEVL